MPTEVLDLNSCLVTSHVDIQESSKEKGSEEAVETSFVEVLA